MGHKLIVVKAGLDWVHYAIISILETRCMKFVQEAQPQLPQSALAALDGPHSPGFVQKVNWMVILLSGLISILYLYYIGFGFFHINSFICILIAV